MHPYAPGSWGPAEADGLVRGLRQVARPVGAVMSAAAKSGKETEHRSRLRQHGAQPAPTRATQAMPQSAAMPSPFPPIADYAFLSDCHTGALMAPDGSVNWLCVPRFDAPSVFGTLLDRQAGDFRFGPFGINVPSARIYEPGTNILLTTWRTPTGWVIVRDALIIGPRRGVDKITPHTRPPTDEDADHLLVRVAMCLDGEVEMELTCEPAFDYGRVPAQWTVSEDGHTADASGAELTIRLQTDMAVGTEGDRVRARHVLKQGEQIFCSLSWAEELASPAEPRRGQRAPGRPPPRFWRDWLSRARIPDHRWRDPIQRSALAIKGLTYMPTGATVAALTTSLPETPGGERNWDYRYTWLRDSTFTLQALHFLNLDWEAEEFMQFVADLEPNADGALQIMYGIDGRRDLTESTREDLSGYAGASPVRVGNGAFDQRQNDVFGAALASILLHTRRTKRLPRRLWPLVQAQAECATKIWREPDQGIWEARGAPQHYVSSKLMCWVAMDRASKLAAIRGDGEAAGHVARDGRGDQGGHPRPRPHEGRRPAPALRDRRARRLQPAGGDLRLPARRRRAPARERAGDRRRSDRGRLRPALPHRRDRRRPVRQGGQLPDLLLLAGLRPGGRRRGAARARPDGKAAAASPRRSGCTPRSSTRAPAGTWGTSPRPSRTSR